MTQEYWYRYEESRYESGHKVWLRGYPVLRATPKGVWLAIGFGERKFVLLDARKRWACPTEGEARESFIARKRRQIRILAGQLDRARQARWMAEEGKLDAVVPKYEWKTAELRKVMRQVPE